MYWSHMHKAETWRVPVLQSVYIMFKFQMWKGMVITFLLRNLLRLYIKKKSTWFWKYFILVYHTPIFIHLSMMCLSLHTFLANGYTLIIFCSSHVLNTITVIIYFCYKVVAQGRIKWLANSITTLLLFHLWLKRMSCCHSASLYQFTNFESRS